MNNVTLMGRLTKAPELKYTQSGNAVVSFTLAVNRSFKNQNGEYEADFINCQAWRKTAEFIAQYFDKGQMMALAGRIQVRTYDDNSGQKRWITEVIAEQVEFCGSKSDSNSSSKNGSSKKKEEILPGEEIVFNDKDLPF